MIIIDAYLNKANFCHGMLQGQYFNMVIINISEFTANVIVTKKS